MANQYLKRTTLHVEGKNDLHSIVHLLKAHAFAMDPPAPGAEPAGTERDVTLEAEGSREKVIRSIRTAVKASTGRAVGFVIDADEDAQATWTSVLHHIEGAIGKRTSLPRRCPPAGAMLDTDMFMSRIGVWVMPDNESPGILEDFMRGLVKAGDAVLPIAEAATDQAKAAGAGFRKVARSKAVMHAWLAWQKEPGQPFGVALKEGCFDVTQPFAQAFVGWVRRLVD